MSILNKKYILSILTQKMVNDRGNLIHFESPSEDNKVKVDDVVATVIGDFGRWQLSSSIMMAFLKFPIAWYQLNIIFLAPPQEFWCVKPEAFSDYSVAEWRDMCAPRIEEFPCLIFDPEILIIFPKMDRAFIPLVECHKFEYDQSVFTRTITSDWDLVCTKRWLVYIHSTSTDYYEYKHQLNQNTDNKPVLSYEKCGHVQVIMIA